MKIWRVLALPLLLSGSAPDTICILMVFIVFIQEEQKKIKREEMDEEASKNKRRMLGNIKFIGELFKLKVIILTILLLFMLSVLQ